MAPFDRKYNADQRKAIFDARFGKDLAYTLISEKATDGTLTGQPFQITPYYVGEICRGEKKRRAGKNRRPIADLATKDSNEFMRKSLLNLWDSERVELERAKPGKRDLARLEQLAKLSIVISRIPGQKDLAPKNPATRNEDGRREPQLVGGTGGALLNAMRQTVGNDHGQQQPDHDDADPDSTDEEGGGAGSLAPASTKRAA